MSFDQSDLKGEKKVTPQAPTPDGEAYEDFQAKDPNDAIVTIPALDPDTMEPMTPPDARTALEAARTLGVMESMPEMAAVREPAESLTPETLAWLGEEPSQNKTLQVPVVRLSHEPHTEPATHELSEEITVEKTAGASPLDVLEETSLNEDEPLPLVRVGASSGLSPTPPHGLQTLNLAVALVTQEAPQSAPSDAIAETEDVLVEEVSAEEVSAEEVVESTPEPAPQKPAPPPPPAPSKVAPPPTPPGAQKAATQPQKKSVSQLEIPPELFEAETKSEAAIPASGTPTVQLPKVLARGWWDTIFNEDFLRTNPAKSEAMTKKEADFIEQCLQPKASDIVLDIACGYGRHVLELATRGYNMVGLDLSLPYLMLAAEIATRRKLPVNFIRGDMRDLPFREYFDSAYCLFTSFGYFDDETNVEVLRGINRSLRPKGRFLLEVINRDFAVSACPLRGWWEGIGCVMLEETEFNFHSSVLSTKRSVIFEDGRQALQETHVRLYSLHELQSLCRQTGFKIIEVSGGVDLKGVFFGSDSPHLLVLLEKQR